MKKYLYGSDNKNDNFLKVFKGSIKDANNLFIAVGYYGASAITYLEESILKVANRGKCKILIGMIYPPTKTNSFKILEQLHKKLQLTSSDNGVYISRKPYHGKIYKIENENEIKYFLGSSNFSMAGLKDRLEVTALIEDINITNEIDLYIENLFDPDFEEAKSLFLHQIEPSTNQIDLNTKASSDLSSCEIHKDSFPTNPNILGEINIKFRPDEQPSSSLNLHFEPGRKVAATSVMVPRPWYEVEVTSTAEERKSKFYPPSKLIKIGKKSRKGTFIAYTQDDGKFYKIKMSVGSDHGKCIASHDDSGGRKILGQLIKDKLERSGFLQIGQRITQDILDDAEMTCMKLIKMQNGEYILEI